MRMIFQSSYVYYVRISINNIGSVSSFIGQVAWCQILWCECSTYVIAFLSSMFFFNKNMKYSNYMLIRILTLKVTITLDNFLNTQITIYIFLMYVNEMHCLDDILNFVEAAI